MEKCGYELSCVLRNGVRHQVSVTGGGQGGTTNITINTEDCQAGYIRNLNTTNSEQEDFIQLTVSSEGSEVGDSYYHHHHHHLIIFSFQDVFRGTISLYDKLRVDKDPMVVLTRPRDPKDAAIARVNVDIIVSG